jgi:hypothetical protein
MSARAGPWTLFRFGLAVVHGFLQLFVAGAVITEAHSLFLRYYAREWQGIQFTGPNGCAGEEMVVNGDLFEAQTLCNQPENFVPWIEVYRNHWQAAAVYYGVGLIVIIIIGYVLLLIQRRLAPAAPFGEAAPTPSLDASEHLR